MKARHHNVVHVCLIALMLLTSAASYGNGDGASATAIITNSATGNACTSIPAGGKYLAASYGATQSGYSDWEYRQEQMRREQQQKEYEKRQAQRKSNRAMRWILYIVVFLIFLAWRSSRNNE